MGYEEDVRAVYRSMLLVALSLILLSPLLLPLPGWVFVLVAAIPGLLLLIHLSKYGDWVFFVLTSCIMFVWGADRLSAPNWAYVFPVVAALLLGGWRAIDYLNKK